MMRPIVLAVMLAITGVAAADWPGFRGDGSSNAPGATPPTTWSVEEGKNVAWTADLPGRGVAGPIVVGGRVVVTASDGPLQERLHVLAFDEATGKRLWARQVWATGRSNCHETSAVAAPTPASDGERVFAFFSSNDLVAYDLAGNLQWMRGLTLAHPGVGNDIGMSSSPVVAGDAVVVQAECQGESFATALDRRTGATLWDIARPKLPNWASPLAWRTAEGRDAVWLQDSSGATLHDAMTGEELARIKNDTAGIPSPAPAADGTLVLAAGEITLYKAPFEKPLLSAGNLQPGSPSPAVAGDKVLVVNRGGVLTCGDLKTGEVVWRERLGGQFWATPVIAGGNAYCISSDGKATVVALDSGKVVSKAEFGEEVLGSPAVSKNAVYFRSHGHLWKIAATGQALAPSDAARR